MGNIADDLLTVGILGTLVLWFLAKWRKESITETIKWLWDMVNPKEEE